MWVKQNGNRIPLRIDQIDVDITITDNIAETVLTLRFRNETERMQEGEFVMPLPDGSTVSQYALEVKGALRDGVAVEKEQARNAYETIKRQMIDPGLVEREAGNKYRTKVFPIPANGTKLVRIGYIEQLHSRGGKLHYSLPTDYPGLINQFTCTIHHDDTANVKAAGLTFNKKDAATLSCQANNKQLPKSIQIATALPPKHTILLEKHKDASYFLLNIARPAEVKEKPRNHPEHINIIWDASESCSHRPLKRELELLDHYFKHLENTRVTLQLLRNTLSSAGEFQIKNGQWQELRKALVDTYYDGSTNYEGIKKNQHKASLTLVFTDGRMAENLTLDSQQSTVIFHSSPVTNINAGSRRGLCQAVNIAQQPIKKLLRQLTHTRFHLAETKPQSAGIIHLGQKDSLSLFGRSNKPIDQFEIIYKNGNGETIRQKADRPMVRALKASQLIKRMWAQEKLTRMEAASVPKSQIISHCREHSLVSDYTSLIVLERFQDYVRFNIPPPEADLREKWKLAIRAKKSTPPSTLGEIANRLQVQWRIKLHWHNTTFTWLSEAIVARQQQVGIWLKAVNKVFHKTDLDSRAYGAVESWYQRAGQLAKHEETLKDKKSYHQWWKQQEKLIAEWGKLSDQKAKRAPNQKLAISVRGLVINPNTYRSKKDLTLKESIKLAGGKISLGSFQHVSLYRNAQCLTYNLLSEKYQDIPLLPGDMIVVEPEPYDPSDYYDTFSGSSDAENSDPRKAPAVIRKKPRYQTESHLAGGGSDADPFGGPMPKRRDTRTIIRVHAPAVAPVRKDAMERFAKALSDGENAVASYRKLKSKRHYHRAFYIEAARILAKHGHRDLAVQVLSNLKENEKPSEIQNRSFAYWLGEVQLWKEALTALEQVKKSAPHNPLTDLDIIRYRQRMEPKINLAEAYDTVRQMQKTKSDIDYRVFALTERNAHVKKTGHSAFDEYTQNLSTDLRCVIYSSDPSVNINTTILEPGDNMTSKWSTSRQGGKLFQAPGIQEYMLKYAMPGTYTIQCSANKPVTVQVAIYSHWGQPKQTCQWTTVHLTTNDTIAAEYTLKMKE